MSLARIVLPIVLAAGLLGDRSAAQSTQILSLSRDGARGNGPANLAGMSGDARWIVFQSAASNLVSGDTNGCEDVFRRDRWTGELVLVSVSGVGSPGDGPSRQPQVSEDGRFVVFQSFADDLVPGDTNGESDIFVRDLVLGRTTRVSVASDGAQADDGSRYPYLSRDGRRVVFESQATNLVPGDTNARKDVFVHDRQLGTTVCVSRAWDGSSADGDSMSPAISPDGEWIGFASLAGNLVPGDTNGVMDVFLHDLPHGTTQRVSCSASGAQLGEMSAGPSLSLHAERVAFFSRSRALAPGDTNELGDVFVKERSTGTLTRVSLSSTGVQGDWESYYPHITPDGRSVVFFTRADSLVPGDTNWSEDVFVRDLERGTLQRVSITDGAQQSRGDSRYPLLSDDARWALFESRASNLVPGDDNSQWDIFLHDRTGAFPSSCSGDGSEPRDCPCANAGGPLRGCANSLYAGGARLSARGRASADDVELHADGLTGALAVVLQSELAPASPLDFGDGLRCLGGSIRRLYDEPVGAGNASAPGPGEDSLRTRSAKLGDPLSAGATRHYQVWYRDPATGFCTSAASNLTNALRIDW